MNNLIEFIKFMLYRKKYWLFPIFLILILLGSILIGTQGSVIAPFIYTMF